MKPASPVTFAVTCSIEAATSLIDETRLSVEPLIDSAWDAVSLSEVVISLSPLRASSRERTWVSAPWDTWSVTLTMRTTASVMEVASVAQEPGIECTRSVAALDCHGRSPFQSHCVSQAAAIGVLSTTSRTSRMRTTRSPSVATPFR